MAEPPERSRTVSEAENAWHDQAVKPLRSLLADSEDVVDMLQDMTPEGAAELLRAMTRFRPLLDGLKEELRATRCRMVA